MPLNVDIVCAFSSNNRDMGTVIVGELDCDSNITVTAVAHTGCRFLGWSDGATGSTRTIHLTGDTLVTALFDFISCAVVGLAYDTVQGMVIGGDTVSYGDTVTLAAVPSFGYHFTHWSDGDSNATRTINVTQDTTLMAYFEINSYTLTLLSNVESLGTVSGSGTYTHGSQATITATPAQGNRFDRWSDNNLLASRTITMTSDLELVAVFVPVDTVYVHDTTYVPVHDTTYIDVHDTTYITVHDTTYVDVPYAVHDTTIVTDTVTLTEYVPVHDTTYIDVPYAVHDTTYIVQTDTGYINVTVYDTVYLTEYDTVTLTLHDTTVVVDTLMLTEYVQVHDTTYIDVPYTVHDTTIVTDTVTEYVPVHDTTYIDVPYAVHDTTIVTDTVTLTEYVPVHDTTYIDVPYAVHDTTYITLTDTLTVTEYDTITNTVYDTVDNYIYDTTIVTDTLWLTQYDTLWLHDTIIIHDTVYITEEGIAGVDALNAKVYSRQRQIVVEGADGNNVTLYDISGRVLATKQDDYSPLRFDAPASGTYMIKVGSYPARKVVVVR